MESDSENLSLFLPFILGIAGIDPSPTRPDPDQNPTDPDHNSPNERNPQTPFIQQMMFIGGTSLSALFQGDDGKQGRPPATKEAIEAMPVVEIGEGESGECAICLEEWGSGGGAVKETPCKHRFHGGCIERWLGMNGSCPVCRFEMPIDQKKIGGGDGGERRIWVSFSFGVGDRSRRNPDRSSSGDLHHTAPAAGGSDIGS